MCRERRTDRWRAARGGGGRSLRLALCLTSALSLGVGCVPVRPEQRAILADRIMQFGANARAEAGIEHALENREGSVGGGPVQGGGCGCN
jgi:Domain of unknown function (DUF4266)